MPSLITDNSLKILEAVSDVKTEDIQKIGILSMLEEMYRDGGEVQKLQGENQEHIDLILARTMLILYRTHGLDAAQPSLDAPIIQDNYPYGRNRCRQMWFITEKQQKSLPFPQQRVSTRTTPPWWNSTYTNMILDDNANGTVTHKTTPQIPFASWNTPKHSTYHDFCYLSVDRMKRPGELWIERCFLSIYDPPAKWFDTYSQLYWKLPRSGQDRFVRLFQAIFHESRRRALDEWINDLAAQVHINSTDNRTPPHLLLFPEFFRVVGLTNFVKPTESMTPIQHLLSWRCCTFEPTKL